MSCPKDPSAVPLPLADWPRLDREAFLAAITPADVFEEQGRASHLAPATIHKYQSSYGRWLRFLSGQGTLDPNLRPHDRVTRDVVKDYVARLQGRLAPTSVWSYIAELHNVLYYIEPETDWDWLRRIVNRLHRLMPKERVSQTALMDICVIYQRGLAVMKHADRRNPRRPLQNELRFRDGLILCLLAAAPLRAKNFAGLKIGSHLQRLPESWVIIVPADESKNRVHADFILPDALAAGLDRYVEVHRPRLLQGKEHEYLWPNCYGVPLKPNKLGQLVPRVTERELGTRLTPHLFRHCAATTIATVSPQLVPIIEAILGHTTPQTAERYYNRATMIEASRRQASALESLRNELSSMTFT